MCRTRLFTLSFYHRFAYHHGIIGKNEVNAHRILRRTKGAFARFVAHHCTHHHNRVRRKRVQRIFSFEIAHRECSRSSHAHRSQFNGSAVAIANGAKNLKALSRSAQRAQTDAKKEKEKTKSKHIKSNEVRGNLFCSKSLVYALFAMFQHYLNTKFVVNMFRQMLCRIDTSMLSARATKREHKIGEATFHISGNMSIG